MIKLKKLIKSLSDERWNIGFIQNDMASILSGEELCVKWLKHDSKYSWFADPFILDVTDNEIHVLVEEYYKPIQRGRISRLIIDRYSYELKQKDVVLELRTHLSFPAIIRKEKDVFIYPENGESGELNLYQYFPESNKCVKIETILSEAVADAIRICCFVQKRLIQTVMSCTCLPKMNLEDIWRKNDILLMRISHAWQVISLNTTESYIALHRSAMYNMDMQ